MIRRRRPAREIAFSFDSFLDVVANVVGIIIRLILVVWVSARSYSSLQTAQKSALPRPESNAPAAELHDPLEQELARHRELLAQAQARLLEQLRQLQLVQKSQEEVKGQLATLSSRRENLDLARTRLDQALAEKGKVGETVVLSLAEVHRRSEKLAEEIRALEKLPPAKQALRYRTPVSQPVHSEELMFECHAGRVTFMDAASLLAEVRRDIDDKVKLLHDRWQVSDTAGPAGAFRLRYVLERERGAVEAFSSDASPDANGGYRANVTSWQFEPVVLERGETLEAALMPGSEFRQTVDAIDPRQTVVTFWVYPDSFALYRRLRDYLYDRDVVVAGRPLPEGVPVSGSQRGSVSRGQ